MTLLDEVADFCRQQLPETILAPLKQHTKSDMFLANLLHRLKFDKPITSDGRSIKAWGGGLASLNTYHHHVKNMNETGCDTIRAWMKTEPWKVQEVEAAKKEVLKNAPDEDFEKEWQKRFAAMPDSAPKVIHSKPVGIEALEELEESLNPDRVRGASPNDETVGAW